MSQPTRSTSRLGALALAALLALASAGTAAGQASVFTDGFESGDMWGWHSSVDPNMPNCNCYFSGDCKAGEFCNYGPGSFSTEDICNWRDTKPNGVPGFGCDLIHVGAWGGPICDGLCQSSSLGSLLGAEPKPLLAAGIELWGRAILEPAIAGGGPIDAELAGRALALDWQRADAGWELGRQVADLLVLTADIRLYDHFCHFEQGDDDPAYFVDLSAEPCRAAAGRLTVEALADAVLEPGSALAVLERLKEECSGWQGLFTLRCPEGAAALGCVRDRVEDAALFVSTPRAAPPTGG